jgi:hypothetical protein
MSPYTAHRDDTEHRLTHHKDVWVSRAVAEDLRAASIAAALRSAMSASG